MRKLIALSDAREVIGLTVDTYPDRFLREGPRITCQYSGLSHEPFIAQIRVNRSVELGADAVASWALRHLTHSMIKSDLMTGYVTFDTGWWNPPGDSPYEQWYNVAPVRSARQGTILSRGYYWANLLGPGHLERLGGQATLAATANDRGMLVQELSTPHVLVRAPGSIEEFSDADLAQMRALLTPVLPKARYWSYVGPPLRILRDPGTAYLPATGDVIPKFDGEGDPVPFRSPWFDQPLD